MADEQRSHEASALRTFFDDQIRHLHDLLDSYFHPEQPADKDEQIIDSFVDAANSKMRAVHGYAEKLRHHVRALHQHVLQVAEQIPPPVVLSRDAFATNQIVNALFVNGDDIERLLRRTPELESYLRSHNQFQTPIVYALLTAGKREKNTLGVGMLGEMLVRDVRRQTVNFHAHEIHIPCASCEELSTAVKHYLFGRVVALIRQEMALRMADQAFCPGDKSYQTRLNSLANPDVYLHTLVEYLNRPADLMSIAKIHYKLSKLGIKLEAGDKQCANEFDLHEISWSDRTRNVVLQIAYIR